MQTNWECFRDAAVVLAGGGPVKQRLLQAYQEHLVDLVPDDLPREIRGPFSTLTAALQSSQRTGSLDAVSASVRKMSEAEAAQHSQAIVRMFSSLQESALSAARPAALLRAVPDDDPIPAFLNRA